METFRIGEGLEGPKGGFDVPGTEGPQSVPGDAFGKMVQSLISDANAAQIDAEKKAEGFAKNEVGVVETVLSVSKADTSLRLLLEVRNRALEAYRELTRAV